MAVEYFTWRAPDIAELGGGLVRALNDDRAKFEATVEHETDDGEDRAQTSGYRQGVASRVRRWCDHFEIPTIANREYDRSVFIPAGVQSWLVEVDYEGLVRRLIESISERPTDHYRPKVMERADAEVMRWLKARPGDVDRVHHRSFEAIVAEVVRDRGWNVELTKPSQDGGYDVLALRTDALGFPVKMVVECKLYGLTHPVGLPLVDRIVGVASREGADQAMLVTNSRFTGVAWQRWEDRVSRDLRLVDRDELFEWLSAYDT